jgi:hypothetical protein
MIIDCHVHLNNYHEDVVVSLDESLDRLRASMAEAGVTYALVLTSYLVNVNRPSIAQVWPGGSGDVRQDRSDDSGGHEAVGNGGAARHHPERPRQVRRAA